MDLFITGMGAAFCTLFALLILALVWSIVMIVVGSLWSIQLPRLPRRFRISTLFWLMAIWGGLLALYRVTDVEHFIVACVLLPIPICLLANSMLSLWPEKTFDLDKYRQSRLPDSLSEEKGPVAEPASDSEDKPRKKPWWLKEHDCHTHVGRFSMRTF